MALSQSYRPFTRRSSSLLQDSIDSASPEERDTQGSLQEQWVLFSPQRNSTLNARSVSSKQTPFSTERSQKNDQDTTSFTAGGYRKDAGKKTDSLLDDQSTRSTDNSRSSALEDEKLDSLDLHLHAFRDTAFQQSASKEYNQTALLPAHDGRGSFLVFGSYEKEQWRSSERLAQPRLGSLSNVNSDHLDGEREVEMARIARIHAWRMEQSVLQQRDHKDPGTRRFGVSRGTRSQVQGGPTSKNGRQKPTSTLPDANSTAELLGVPDYAPIDSPEDDSAIRPVGWLDRLLNRIAYELGIYANHLTVHPSAFTTYPQYGEPTIPWQHASMSAQRASNSKGRLYGSRRNSYQSIDSTQQSSIIFRPTVWVGRKNYSGSRDSEQVQNDPSPSVAPLRTQSMVPEESWSELDYWERKLDFAAVVTFVYDRFFLSRYSTGSQQPSAVSALEQHSDPTSVRSLDCAHPTAGAAAAARAATIWQTHPPLPSMATWMNINSLGSQF